MKNVVSSTNYRIKNLKVVAPIILSELNSSIVYLSDQYIANETIIYLKDIFSSYVAGHIYVVTE